MPDDDKLELNKRYIRVMLSSVETLSEHCRQMSKPVPYELEVKYHYFKLAEKQLEEKNLSAYRAVLEEMKTFLETS